MLILYHLYADDCQLQKSFNSRADGQEDIQAANHLEQCICKISKWMKNNKIRLNRDETEYISNSSLPFCKFFERGYNIYPLSLYREPLPIFLFLTKQTTICCAWGYCLLTKKYKNTIESNLLFWQVHPMLNAFQLIALTYRAKQLMRTGGAQSWCTHW